MSLICSQCHGCTGPTEELPGRHTTMVYVVTHVKGFYIENRTFNLENSLQVVWISRSLCFQCIDDAITKQKNPISRECIELVYRQSQLNLEKARRAGTFMTDADFKRNNTIYEIGDRLRGEFFDKCIFCQEFVNEIPHLVAFELDRPHVIKNDRDKFFSSIFSDNYQTSDTRLTSDIAFHACFKCFTSEFPETINLLGHDLSSKGDPITPLESEFIIAAGLYEDLCRIMSPEEFERRAPKNFTIKE